MVPPPSPLLRKKKEVDEIVTSQPCFTGAGIMRTRTPSSHSRRWSVRNELCLFQTASGGIWSLNASFLNSVIIWRAQAGSDQDSFPPKNHKQLCKHFKVNVSPSLYPPSSGFYAYSKLFHNQIWQTGDKMKRWMLPEPLPRSPTLHSRDSTSLTSFRCRIVAELSDSVSGRHSSAIGI